MLMRKKDIPGTFLEQGTMFEGDLKFRGTLRINGDFIGDILQGSKIIVGEKANIKGNIHVAIVIFSGEIHGNIVANEKVEVHPSGRVFGSIRAPKVFIDERAIFVGTCDVQQAEPAPAIGVQEKKKTHASPDLQNQAIAETSDRPILEPTEAAMASVKVRSDKDGIEAFLEDYCTASSDSQVQAKAFYEAYCKWCESKNHTPLSMVQFGQIMTKKYQKITVAGRRFYQGICLSKET